MAPHCTELCAYPSALTDLNNGRIPAGPERGTGDPIGATAPGANRRRHAGVAQVSSASPTANPVGIETQEVAVPFIDPAYPSPWLESLRASRRRRAEATRQARRKRAGRGGASALLA